MFRPRYKQLGYYDGPINGLLEPATQDAIANYQRDHGLYADIGNRRTNVGSARNGLSAEQYVKC